MVIAIDATIGSVNSNSYVTVVRSNILAETLPHMSEWLTDIDINKPQLLLHATRMIDTCFIPPGNRVSESQALAWPRDHVVDVSTGLLLSNNAIPLFVELATVEWAGELYRNPEPHEDVGYGLKRLETPSYRMEFNGQSSREIPRAVQRLLGPYNMKMASPFHRVVRM